ncbi:hypothetical protein DFJ58DRAFT_409903 [Suillus subalutaceus]|uniref:uncharacterized protein n=1 Tax=Suillus subalutaceus TaxID=48586 RepID=UPI001B8680C1|nr:uncharacterized protein DFJ58DRAFT_409903 [Suillus subalutaceus]KAG1873070.1 hypothetical protein DFJ58DRAFT_409903 [Suillus subalutaceus]
MHPSQWPSETDVSFDSSALQPTPSIQSAALQEGIDGSFETSFMRPSISPLSSIARLTPITETISSLTPSPRQMFHPVELVSSPSSGPTPLTMSTSASSSLSRTASTVSGVSSIAIEAEEEDAVSVRAASDISTVPSLLSTRSEESVRYMPMPSPRAVPLPVSPAPTSVSMSVSVTTPHEDVPSIHSVLETEHTHTHTEQTITHDIDRLLHHIQEIDQFRGQETQEIAENVRAIRDELYDLSEYVRTRLVVERSPPVPTRDTSVGGSSVPSTPRGPRPRPGLTLVEMSPPPMHPSSPSSPSSVMSFLSSHHSDDDLSLLETEVEAQTVERSYSISREPSWPSSSSSSSSPVTPSEISSSEPSPGPSLSATSSSSPTPPPSSPTPSTASTTTVRQRDSITIETLRDMLISLREQTTALWEGQMSTNHMLDELRETRSGPLDTTEFNDRFQAIEVLLRQLIDRRVETERPVHIQPPSESISDVGTDVDAEDFQQRWQDWTRLLRDRVPLAAPQPRRARGNLDDELLALLQAPPPQVPIGVQPPPALIPFAYQPAVRPPRSRSTSPILRPSTYPIATEPVLFSPEIQHPRIRRPPRGPRVGERLPDRPATETETVFSGPRRPPTQPPVPPPPPGDFSDPRPLRPMPPPEPIPWPGRAPSAPADLGGHDDTREPQTWYRPPRSQGLGMPPQPVIPGQQGGRQYVPMPPGPTVVQLPLFDTLMNILREHRLAQLATVDQQRELMRYMRGLNEWLERDVQDRQAELRGVTARVDELRNDLARLGLGMQPGVQPGVQPPGAQLPGVFPGYGVIPVGPIPHPPTGFVPQGGPRPPVIPTYDGSPPPDQYSPFIPDEPQWRRPLGMPEPQHYLPGAQGPVIPGASGGFPQPQHGDRHERRPGDEDEGFIPTSSPQFSDAGLPTRPFVPEHTFIVQPSDVEGSDDSSDTQHTYAPDVHHVPHPPEDQMLHIPQDIPDVIHSGEHTHSHGSPPPQTININVPPQYPQEPQVGVDQRAPIQQGLPYVIPPPPMFPGPGGGPEFQGPSSGPPLVIHPPPRSRSGSSSGRRPVVIQQSPPVVLQLPHGEQVARHPTRQEFDVPPSGGGAGGPVVRLPGSVGHVDRSRSRSRSPRGWYRDRHRYPPYDDPYYRRGRHPYSPDYDHPRHWDDRRRRYYSPEYGPRRRYYDDYSPRRGGPRDYYSRSPSPRRGERYRDDDPSRREGRSPSHRAPTRSEGDPSRRGDRSPTHRTSRRPSHDEGDRSPTHRTSRRPSYDEGDRSPTHRTSRRPSYDEGDRSPTHRTSRRPSHDEGDRSPTHRTSRRPSYDEGDRSPTHRTPTHLSHDEGDRSRTRTPTHLSHEEGDRSPTHRTPSRPRTFTRLSHEGDHPPTQYSEEDVLGPSRHTSSHGRRTPSHGQRTPSHGIPASPRFEDPPRSPTVIRIEQERGYPESPTGQPVIIAPAEQLPFRERRSRSPTSELRRQLRHSPDVYIPTVYSVPSVRDDDGRRSRRTPPVTEHDDGRPPRHRLSPARGDEADPGGRRSASRFPDDEAGSRRAASQAPYDEADPYGDRAASQIPDDEADPGRRAASRVPSRTGSQAGRVPAVIQQDDGSRQESEMVHIPPPGDHGHPPDHDPHVHFDPTATEFDDALNRRHERLDEVERELNQVVQGAHEAEDRREAEFRDSEDHREQIFLQNEQRRDNEARQRGDELFSQLEERARSVPPSTGSSSWIRG